jgi:DNA-binding MarR family transcriptional regulator
MPVQKRARLKADSVDRIAADWEAAMPRWRTDALHVFGRIQHLARFYEQALTRVGKRHGIALGDVYVLLALKRSRRRLTATELFRELSVTSGAVSKRVDRLVALNLVERRPDESDRRGIKVSITGAGSRIVEQEVLFSREFTFLAAYELSGADRKDLTTLLRRLLSLMESHAGRAVGPKGALEVDRDDDADATPPRRRRASAGG